MGEDSMRVRQSMEAQRTGGPCPICGWKDGDGAKVCFYWVMLIKPRRRGGGKGGNGAKACFYSQTLGAVIHQDSDKAAADSTTAGQRSLFEAYTAPGCSRRHECNSIPHLWWPDPDVD